MNIQILLEIGGTKNVNGRKLFDKLVIICKIIE